jgi:hypothetical protein
MRSKTAAAYCDEKSVEAFLSAVGTLYPAPRCLKGKGDRWLKEDLDQAIETVMGMAGRYSSVTDASAVL